MLEKIVFDQTPSNSIRVWLHFNKDNDFEIMNKLTRSDLWSFLQFSSVWGGYDKRELGMVSFEIPMTLKDFIKKKFESYYCETVIRLG